MKIHEFIRFGGVAILTTFLSSACASGRAVTAKRGAEARPVSEHHRVYFEFNQADVRLEDEGLLNRVASEIQNDGKAVAILEGHTDQIGAADYNEALAENRARSVRVYLRDHGADPRRLTVLSKGEREPIVEGKNRNVLQPNRRVEILLTVTGRTHD